MNSAAAVASSMPSTMITDNSTILGTTNLPYMANPLDVLQQHHTPMASSGNPPTATKQSKAIKIVNPDTMKEVNTSNLKKTSPASLFYSTPKHENDDDYDDDDDANCLW